MHQSVSQLRRHDQFHSEFLQHDRDVLVWLPPGYPEVRRERSTQPFDTTVRDGGSRTPVPNDRDEPSGRTPVPNHRYPVLYMHDGQNLFEPDTAFNKGEHWRVGETATRLIEAGRIEPLIVVGIYNTGDARVDEYTPTGDHKLGGGHADDYGRMIIEELKPLIDRTYHTRADAAHTGIAGSSLGGLVSLYLGFTHPRVFTRIAALSPSVWWGRKAILKTIRESRSKPDLRLWVDMGTAEGRRGLDDARLLKAALVGLGFSAADLHYAEYEGATHSEQAWSERVGPMLEWLFPADTRTVVE
jgi:predicted alpha/beta superfamily hydrolase